MAMKSSSVMLVVLGLVALMSMSAPKAQAQFGIGLGVVTGNVSCSLNSSTSAPPFPNATVLLQCGGTTLATAVTNSSGTFSITLTIQLLFRFLRDLIFGNCNIVVTTPLVNCNATLPSTGSLVGTVVPIGLDLIGFLLTLIFGIISITFVP